MPKECPGSVRRRLEERGGGVKLGLPDTARVTWHRLLEGRIVRCTETRTQDERLHYGSIDLSGQPEYGGLFRCRLAPPKDLTKAQKVTLVRRGSVTERSCDGCSNGKNPCPRCQGRGDLPCEPSTVCADCRGVGSCLRCEGNGHRIRSAPDSQQPAGERVLCRRCGALDAACPTCCGRGHTACTTCDGRGVHDCPECDRAGTMSHQSCQGADGTVTWTEATISRTPMIEPVKHPKAGVPNPARELARASGKWRPVRLTYKDTLPKDLADEFRNLAQSYLAPHEGEIGRGLPSSTCGWLASRRPSTRTGSTTYSPRTPHLR